jgi:hypothetical protein
MHVAEYGIRQFQWDTGSRLGELRLEFRRKIGIDGERHVTDFVDGRLIEDDGLAGFTSAQLFDIEAIDEIAELVETAFDAAMIRKRIGGVQQSVYSGIEFAARGVGVALEIELAAGFEMLLRAGETLVGLGGMR